MVRGFFPQGANRSIVANTNFPPQDSSISGVSPDVGDAGLESIFPPQGDTSYDHYKFYYIPQNTINSPKTDYPITIVDTLGFGVFKDSEGHDVRFFLEDGITEPDFYIVQADQNTGFFKAVVKFPTLDNGSFVQMCVGKSSFTDFTNPAATWPSQYISVYDMDKIVSPDVVVDSAGSNDGDAEFDVVQATDSLFGNFLNFNTTATNGRIDLGNPSDFPDGLNPRTMSMWVRPADVSASLLTIMAYGTNTSDASMLLGKGNATDGVYGTQNTQVNVDNLFPTPDIFYKLVYTYDGITAKLFLNGNLEDFFTDTFSLVRNDAHIGTDLNLINNWKGGIFDVRIQDIDQSTDEETILLDFLAESGQLFEESALLRAFFDNIFEATSKELITPIQVIPNNWFDSNFKQRIPITINAGQVPSAQTDFPLLINSTFIDLIGNTQSLGQDIRIASSDGTELKYEIQDYDNLTGELILWTKAPTIDNGTLVHIYFDNPTATDNQDQNAVWNDGSNTFRAVWHMNQNPSLTNLVDSTINNNIGIRGDAPVPINGKIGNAIFFRGAPDVDRFAIPNSPTLDIGTLTFSAWVKAPDNSQTFPMILSRDNGGIDSFQFRKNTTTGTLQLIIFKTSDGLPVSVVGTTDIGDNAFHHVVGTLDGIDMKVYVDGILEATNTINDTMQVGTVGIRIAIRASNVNPWEGTIDELRIAIGARDINWIKTEFNNQNDPSTFYTIGFAENFYE